MIIVVILTIVAAVVVILGARQPVRVLALGVLGFVEVGLLWLRLEYGTIEPCHLLAHQIVKADAH
jgi:hypothetical protein